MSQEVRPAPGLRINDRVVVASYRAVGTMTVVGHDGEGCVLCRDCDGLVDAWHPSLLTAVPELPDFVAYRVIDPGQHGALIAVQGSGPPLAAAVIVEHGSGGRAPVDDAYKRHGDALGLTRRRLAKASAEFRAAHPMPARPFGIGRQWRGPCDV